MGFFTRDSLFPQHGEGRMLDEYTEQCVQINLSGDRRQRTRHQYQQERRIGQRLHQGEERRMSNHYIKELRDLALELREQARQVDHANDPEASAKSAKWLRQADVLDFILD